jgi:ABC-2 type transport system ATP-binding protein
MIRVSNLQKIYRVPQRAPGLGGAFRSLFSREVREVRAVDGISFEIAPGERVGFLGPNGAGKTTTLKMLAGLLMPTAGELSVHGHVPGRREVALLEKITLVMGQKQQLLWDLPPRDTFELNRALYQIPAPAYRETVDELTRLLELGPLLGRPTRNLSLGERMKCELAAALLHRPSVLFLDEPTIGLDVVMQLQVRQFIAAWNARFQSTVLLTSHYMDDVEALCPRVIVIARGTLRYDGTLTGLVERHQPLRRVRLRPPSGFTGRLPEPFRTPAMDETALPGGEVDSVADVPPGEIGALLHAALTVCPGADVRIEEPPLEEVFARLFRSEATS